MSILFIIYWSVGLWINLTWLLKKLITENVFLFDNENARSKCIHWECWRVSEMKCDMDTSLFENQYVLFLGRRVLSGLSLLVISRSFLAAYPSTGTLKDTWTVTWSAVLPLQVICVIMFEINTCLRGILNFLNWLKKVGQLPFQAFCWRRLNHKPLKDVWIFFLF